MTSRNVAAKLTGKGLGDLAAQVEALRAVLEEDPEDTRAVSGLLGALTALRAVEREVDTAEAVETYPISAGPSPALFPASASPPPALSPAPPSPGPGADSPIPASPTAAPFLGAPAAPAPTAASRAADSRARRSLIAAIREYLAEAGIPTAEELTPGERARSAARWAAVAALCPRLRVRRTTPQGLVAVIAAKQALCLRPEDPDVLRTAVGVHERTGDRRSERALRAYLWRWGRDGARPPMGWERWNSTLPLSSPAPPAAPRALDGAAVRVPRALGDPDVLRHDALVARGVVIWVGIPVSLVMWFVFLVADLGPDDRAALTLFAAVFALVPAFGRWSSRVSLRQWGWAWRGLRGAATLTLTYGPWVSLAMLLVVDPAFAGVDLAGTGTLREVPGTEAIPLLFFTWALIVLLGWPALVLTSWRPIPPPIALPFRAPSLRRLRRLRAGPPVADVRRLPACA